MSDYKSEIDNLPLETIAKNLGMEYRAKLDIPEPPRDLLFGEFDRIAGSWGRQYKMVPIAGDEHSVTVAISNPDSFSALQQLKYCYQRPIKVVLTSEAEISNAINSIRTSLMSDRTNELSNEEEDAEDIAQNLKIDVTDADDDEVGNVLFELEL